MIEVEVARDVVTKIREIMSNALKCVSKPEPDWEEYQYELWCAASLCNRVREVVNE